MEKSRLKWSEYYKEDRINSVKNDNWLEKYKYLFKNKEKILELGCGFGFNSLYLKSTGHDVTASDFSENAILELKKRDRGIKIIKLDLRNKFQFKDNTFDSIIADLCLHYFNSVETIQIVSEIRRILKNSGKFFFRVNSVYDINHGAGSGVKIEHDFYNINGIYKRFFTESSIKEYFSDFNILSIKNYEVLKYEKPKNVYEVICIKGIE